MNSFDACNDDESILDRFFCFILSPDPSNRTEFEAPKLTFDKLNSDEKISFSSGTEKVERIQKVRKL